MAGFLLSPMSPRPLCERHRQGQCNSVEISAMLRSISEVLVARPRPPSGPASASAGAQAQAPRCLRRAARVRAFGPMPEVEPDAFGDRCVDRAPNAFCADQCADHHLLVPANAGWTFHPLPLLQDEVSQAILDLRLPHRILGHMPAKQAQLARRHGWWREDVADKCASGPPLTWVVHGVVADIRGGCWKRNLVWMLLYRQNAFDGGGVATGSGPGDHVIGARVGFGENARGFADTIGAIGQGTPMLGSELSTSTPDPAVGRDGIPRVDFIKMDMEVSEPTALRVATATIRRSWRALPLRRVTGTRTTSRPRRGSTPWASGAGCAPATAASIGDESCYTRRVRDWRHGPGAPVRCATRGLRCPMRPRGRRGTPRTSRPRRTCNNTP